MSCGTLVPPGCLSNAELLDLSDGNDMFVSSEFLSYEELHELSDCPDDGGTLVSSGCLSNVELFDLADGNDMFVSPEFLSNAELLSRSDDIGMFASQEVLSNAELLPRSDGNGMLVSPVFLSNAELFPQAKAKGRRLHKQHQEPMRVTILGAAPARRRPAYPQHGSRCPHCRAAWAIRDLSLLADMECWDCDNDTDTGTICAQCMRCTCSSCIMGDGGSVL